MEGILMRKHFEYLDCVAQFVDPSTMIFFRNKHIMIDLGTDNNKINWALKDKQEFIDIIETVYRGARKGRGLICVSFAMLGCMNVEDNPI
ncbi:hypothetical protein GOBAR_DD26316 [Gossypium barbadense]|nr:hypothetical protein GOBAR_DD26316 [Gossypium barbadense]